MHLIFLNRLKRKFKVLFRNLLEHMNLYSHFPKPQSQFVFVVGCSNSGTTLLTTILGRNSKVLALGDESYIFGQDKIYMKASIKQWDIICRQFNKEIFVEKTPKHIYEIDRIFNFIPNAKILFIVRNPEDTVASLVTRGVNFSYAVKKYIYANNTGLHYANMNNVYLCRFEELVKNSKTEIYRICSFLSLEFEESMLSGTDSVFHIWSQTNQANKNKRSNEVTQKITDTTGSSSHVLSKEQIKFIEAKTSHITEMVNSICNIHQN